MNNTRRQYRKVQVLGEDVKVHFLQHREWVVHTPVGMVTFRHFGKLWTAYYRDEYVMREREMNEHNATLLTTAVQRVMLRAKVAVAVASAFRVLGPKG